MPQRRRRRRKRVPIGEALRKHGLDEHTIAGTYVHVVDNLKKNPTKAGSGDKLLVDILKECSRQIEAVQPVADGAIQVQLVHNVERPVRTATPEAASPEGEK
jgi:hypothetical protein